MRTEITRIIRRDGLRLLTGKTKLDRRDENLFMRGTLRRIGGHIPSGRRYRVTFRLNENGQLTVHPWLMVKHGNENGYSVCFLPVSWVGKRIDRIVEEL